jgi:putative transposase
MPTVNHLNHVYANNRAEVSHQLTRQPERAMRGFKAPAQAQRFLTLLGLTQHFFRLGRPLLQPIHYRFLTFDQDISKLPRPSRERVGVRVKAHLI